MELLSSIADEDIGKQIKRLMDLYLIELGALEDAYIASRYLIRDYKKEEAKRLLKAVKEITENVH